MVNDNNSGVDDASDQEPIMNSTISTTVRPIPVTRRTHYYQGRPNALFLERYRTMPAPRTPRPV